MNTYILQKDSPNAKAGVEFTKWSNGLYVHFPDPNNQYNSVLYRADKVENNPEWFKKKEAHPVEKEIIQHISSPTQFVYEHLALIVSLIKSELSDEDLFKTLVVFLKEKNLNTKVPFEFHYKMPVGVEIIIPYSEPVAIYEINKPLPVVNGEVIKLLTAKDAFGDYEKIGKSHRLSQLFKEIQSAAGNGQLSITVSKSTIEEDNIKTLEALEYKVSGKGAGEHFYTISWNNEKKD